MVNNYGPITSNLNVHTAIAWAWEHWFIGKYEHEARSIRRENDNAAAACVQHRTKGESMNSMLTKIVMDVLASLPEVSADIEDVIKNAESPEDGKAKAKAILADVVKIVSNVANML